MLFFLFFRYPYCKCDIFLKNAHISILKLVSMPLTDTMLIKGHILLTYTVHSREPMPLTDTMHITVHCC